MLSDGYSTESHVITYTFHQIIPHPHICVCHTCLQSDVVRVDLTKIQPEIIGRVRGVGQKAHGMVAWQGLFISLDSDRGALVALEPTAARAAVHKLWQVSVVVSNMKLVCLCSRSIINKLVKFTVLGSDNPFMNNAGATAVLLPLCWCYCCATLPLLPDERRLRSQVVSSRV